jgi:D-3-phosphoglycerate dehydrogenase
MESRSKKDYAYTVFDAKGNSDGIADKVKGVGDVISARVIR